MAKAAVVIQHANRSSAQLKGDKGGRRTGVAAAEHEDAGGGGDAGPEERAQRRVRLVPVEELAGAGSGGTGGGGGVAGVPVGGVAVVVAPAVAAAHPDPAALPSFPAGSRGEGRGF